MVCFCKGNDILLEVYSLFGIGVIFENEFIKVIVEKYGKLVV